MNFLSWMVSTSPNSPDDGMSGTISFAISVNNKRSSAVRKGRTARQRNRSVTKIPPPTYHSGWTSNRSINPHGLHLVLKIELYYRLMVYLHYHQPLSRTSLYILVLFKINNAKCVPSEAARASLNYAICRASLWLPLTPTPSSR